MKEQFKLYLIGKTFKPNTVEDYVGRIVRVCRDQHMSLATMGARIDNIVQQYDDGGIKSDVGKRSHESVKNAIKHFRSFYKTIETHLNQPQTTSSVLA